MDKEIKIELNKWLIAFVNNIVLFTLTFFVSFVAFNSAIVFTSRMIGIEVKLDNYTIPVNAASGNFSHVFMIFLSGPIVLVVLGVFFYTMFSRFKKKRGILKILFLWGYLNAFNMLLANIVIGLLTESGIGEIAWRLHFSDFFKIFLIFISLIIVVLIGSSNSKYFYTTSFSRSFIENRRKRVMFLVLVVLLPFLIGISLFSLVNYGAVNSSYLGASFLSMALLLTPSFRNNKSYTQLRIIKESTPPAIVWGWVIILAALAILYRFSLGLGFSF